MSQLCHGISHCRVVCSARIDDRCFIAFDKLRSGFRPRGAVRAATRQLERERAKSAWLHMRMEDILSAAFIRQIVNRQRRLAARRNRWLRGKMRRWQPVERSPNAPEHLNAPLHVTAMA